MAITLAQMAASIDDPNLGNRVVGAAIAAAKQVVEAPDPKPANYAQRVEFAKKIWTNPQAEAKPMIRVLLADSYKTAALSWNENPEAGQSNLVVNVTDDAFVSAVFSKWNVFVALDA
jgi:uncharacterized protein (DUF1778 family)